MNALKHRPAILQILFAFLLLRLCACANNDKQIASLIEKMKTEDEFSPGSKYSLEIAKFSDKATPLLLKEWKKSSHYVFGNLTNTLCLIPSKARDDAFVEFLSNHAPREDAWLAWKYASNMIDALAQNMCMNAVPVLKKIATDAKAKSEIRPHAIAALGLLESPLAPRPPEQFVVIQPSAKTAIQNLNSQSAAAAMYSVLDQALCHITTSTLTLEKAGKDNADLKLWRDEEIFPGEMASFLRKISAETIQYDCSGRFTGHRGGWEMNLCLISEKDAVVYAHYQRGPVWGAGYVGRLIRRNERWILISWRMVWIS